MDKTRIAFLNRSGCRLTQNSFPIFLSSIFLSNLLLFLAITGFAASNPAKMASPKIAPGKPEIFQLEPRGIQRGLSVKIKLIGTNLIGLTELKLPDPGLKGELLETPAASTNEAWIEVIAATN